MRVKLKLLLGFSILCIIIGIALIVVGKIKETSKVTEKILTVVDAGGSGTRLHVYKYIDHLSETSFKCERTGLENYDESEYPKVVKLLEACYAKGHKLLPEGAVTPIWFGATAGMRLLKLRDLNGYNKIWKLINSTLNATDYEVKWSDTFTGDQEARFSWVAANMLEEQNSKSEKTTGMTELGSSSLQIAFQVEETPSVKNHIEKTSLNGNDYNLYRYSYLCYGETEIRRRIQAQLVKNANFNKTVEDPCSFKHYNWSLSSDYLWNVPCVKGNFAKEHFGYEIDGPKNSTYKLIGTGDPQKCLKLVRSIINANCTDKNESCGMEGVYQSHLHGKYLALSSYYFTTEYIGVPLTGSTPEDFWQKTVDICERPYDKLTPPYKEDSEKFKSLYCAQSVLSYFLLNEGLKFNKDTWNIDFTKKIDGKSVEWALGVAYLHQSEAYTHQVDQFNKKFHVMFVVGIIVVIIAAILLAMAIAMAYKDHKGYENVE